MNDGPANSQISCPRCGYDQRGVVATWIEQCPLEGICTECGLRMTWAEVLHPSRFEPGWCVEFVRRAMRFPRACFATFFRSFWPWGFWSQLKMSHPVRPRRLALYLLFLFLLPLLCYVPIQAGVAIYVRYQTQQLMAQQFAALPAAIQRMQSGIQAMQTQTNLSSDPQGAAMVQQQIAMLQQQVARMQAVTSPPTIEFSYPMAVLEAIFMPLAQTSYGTVAWGPASFPYTAPSDLWNTALRMSSFAGGGGGSFGWGGSSAFQVPLEILFGGFACGLALMVLLPASFILLPVSRRRAKVRWSHIGRVAAYGVFIPVTAVLLCAAFFVLGVLFESSADSFHRWMILLVSPGVPIVLILWWGAAIGRYMKIPHGHFTAVVLMILCALLILAGVWLSAPVMLLN